MENEIVSTCPTCKHKLDCVTPMQGKSEPDTGDPSVCFNCGEFLIFTDPPKVRKMEFIEEVSMDDATLDAMKQMRYRIIQKKAYKSILAGFVGKSYFAGL